MTVSAPRDMLTCDPRNRRAWRSKVCAAQHARPTQNETKRKCTDPHDLRITILRTPLRLVRRSTCAGAGAIAWAWCCAK
eukprot:9208384-Pyramimonas_sp.AAC.1